MLIGNLKVSKAYICHAYADDPIGNRQRVTDLCRQILAESFRYYENDGNKDGSDSTFVVPVAPHLTFSYLMENMRAPLLSSKGAALEAANGVVHRIHALEICKELIRTCDEVWVCFSGETSLMTAGMMQEVEFATGIGKPIKFYL